MDDMSYQLPSIKSVLMKRDSMTADEADDLIAEAKEELYALLDGGDMDAAYNICQDYFGLEPDFLDELMFA